MRIAALIVTAGLVLVGACADRLPPPPRPAALEPGSAATGVAVPVVIRGSGFSLGVEVSYDDEARTAVATDFRAYLGETELVDVAYVDAGTLTATIPPGLAAGTHDLRVVDPAGQVGTLTGAFVAVGGGVAIEDAPGGAGGAVADRAMFVGATLALFAVQRDAGGAFVADVEVEWRLAGAIGTLAPVAGAATVLTATTAGTGVVTAAHSALGAAATGTITVSACGRDDDCRDPCRASHACQDGACVMGPVDKDLDGDGFLDAACPGGTDCDDDPGACGAACAPGLLERCDGRDNDCDPATADGAGEPDLGLACDGPDTDLCLEGAWTCAGAALVCSDDTDDGREGPSGDPSCADGVDNDCDGLTDDQDPGCGVNTPPLVVVDVAPPAGTTATLFRADATGTSDRQDAPAALAYEWDWDGDGAFEATGVTATHVYSTTGEHPVTVRVTDTGGLAAYATFVVVVSPASDLITVTTGADEADPGATPAAPGGAGLSLREAMLHADATAGQQTILIPAGTVVALASQLPTPTDAAGVWIVGDGAVIDGSGIGGAASSCFDLASSNNRLYGLEITGCAGWPLYVHGAATGNRVARCVFHDNGWGIQLEGSGNFFGPGNTVRAVSGVPGLVIVGAHVVEWSRFATISGAAAVRLSASADGSLLLGNVIQGCTRGVDVDSNSDGNRLWHNTIQGSTGDGVSLASNVAATDLRDTIIASSGQYAIRGRAANFAQLDYNDYFANGLGVCSACASLGANSLEVDPGFVDVAADDLRIRSTSPLVDAGLDLGVDVNGAAPGSYGGARPDIGAAEAP